MFYILVDGVPQKVKDVLEYAEWDVKNSRKIAKTEIYGLVVSTVFLGIDHNFSGKGDPILFETMVFSETKDPKFRKMFEMTEDSNFSMRRSTTVEEAKRNHAIVVSEIKRRFAGKDLENEE